MFFPQAGVCKVGTAPGVGAAGPLGLRGRFALKKGSRFSFLSVISRERLEIQSLQILSRQRYSGRTERSPKHSCSSGLKKEAPRKIGDFPPLGLHMALFDCLFVLIFFPSVPSGFVPLFLRSLCIQFFLVHLHLQKCCERSTTFAAITTFTPSLLPHTHLRQQLWGRDLLLVSVCTVPGVLGTTSLNL